MKTPLAACLAALLSVAPAAAQTTPKQKPPAPQGMDTGHSDQRVSRSAVVSEGPDQILATNVVGQPLYARKGGDRLGTIKDALVRRDSGMVELVILDTGGKNARRALAWNSIDMRDRKHLTADLTKADIENTSADRQNGKTLDERAKQGQDYDSVADRLLGKEVVSSTGGKVGKIGDLVVGTADAKIADALIDIPTGLAIGVGDTPRAVPWSAVTLPADKGKPIALSLTKEQVAMEPGFATKAPEAPGTEGAAPMSGSSTNPRQGAGKTGAEPTLDLGGKPIAPPDVSRRNR
jgi:sporulation protein YlmC with PRC-barrel domain